MTEGIAHNGRIQTAGRYKNTSTRFHAASRAKIEGITFSQHAAVIMEYCALRSFSCYSPESRHGSSKFRCPLCAKSGQSALQQKSYSITLSVRSNTGGGIARPTL